MYLYSKSIISWVLTKTMDADEVLKCIEKAKGKRNIVKPLVIQSNICTPSYIWLRRIIMFNRFFSLSEKS